MKHITRVERGAERMYQRGTRMPFWMLCTRTLDSLYWRNFYVDDVRKSCRLSPVVMRLLLKKYI